MKAILNGMYYMRKQNAILKVAKSTNSCEGAVLYLTLSPCRECAKLIHQSGIKKIVYINEYKDDSGIRFLRKAGVEIQQLNPFAIEEK